MVFTIFFKCLDSNRGPLKLEATALPTEPQPLPTEFLIVPTPTLVAVMGSAMNADPPPSQHKVLVTQSFNCNRIGTFCELFY